MQCGKRGIASHAACVRSQPPHSVSCHVLCMPGNDDLYSFDPASLTWTLLSDAATGARPSARSWHGFTSAGGKLYVHGGMTAQYGNCFVCGGSRTGKKLS